MKKFDTEVRLSREMSLMDVTLIGVGAMIGAGIFVLTGIAAGVAGPALILVFALNGLVALLTAMSYAELGSCFHDAGGGYLWVKESLPRWSGFLAGWMSWAAHAVACSLYALGFGAYFDHVLQEFGATLPHWGFLSPQKMLAAAVAVLFAWINFRGASETGKIGSLVTLTKIVILLVFIGFGLEVVLHKGDLAASFTPFFANGWTGVVKAMGLTFIAFEGFEVIAQCSEEVKHPRRNIPRAVFLSLLIVVPIYLLVAVVALGAVHPEGMTSWDYLAAHKEIALVDVAKGFFAGGGVMLLVGGLISTMSALNATVYSSSRVAFAMGRDRNFPTLFSRVHPKRFTPHWAILISMIVIVLMAVSLPIEDVASAADIMFLLLFLMVNLAMIRLRTKRPELKRGFVTPLYPYLSILGIAMLLGLAAFMFSYSIIAWVLTAIWVLAGLFINRFYASRREEEHVRTVRALERIERKEYRILVAVSNPVTLGDLSKIALAVAKRGSAEILFVHVIEVPDRQPLRAGLEEQARGTAFLDLALEQVEGSAVPARAILKVSHRISQGIVDTVREEECNFLVLGRQQHQKFLDRLLSSVIDVVVQEAPCEVLALYGRLPAGEVRDILIPFSHGVHTRLAVEIAPALADQFNSLVRIGVVFAPEVPEENQRGQLQKIEGLVRENKLQAEVAVVRDRDILHGVLDLAKRADLLVMAGRTGDFLELLFSRSLTQQITEEVRCPVLWVREYEEKRSLWKILLRPYAQEVKEDE